MLLRSRTIHDPDAKPKREQLSGFFWMFRATVLACLTAALLCQSACKKGKKKSVAAVTDPAVVVKVSPAVEKDFPVYYKTVGQLASPAGVKVTALVSGILEKVHFSEGDMVKKGELLFSIDDRPYAASLTKAKAAIAKGKSDVAVAQSKVERSRKLVQDKFIAAQDFDALKQDVVSAQTSLEVDKLDVDLANIQLAYTKIEAPISGKTGIIQVQGGNLAEPGSDNYLVSIVQLDPLYVDFTIPVSMGGDVKKSYKQSKDIISINSSDDGLTKGEWQKGTLEFVDNQADSKSGTLKLRGSVKNAEGMLWPGQFVTINLTLDVLKKAIVIPTLAIRAREIGAFVYVMGKDGKAKVTPVELGPRNGDFVAVTSGLKAGEKVITEGQIGLRDGSNVTLADSADSPSKEKKPAAQ